MFDIAQTSLFGQSAVSFDSSFTGISRRTLNDGAWVEYVPGWLTGDERLFRVVEERAAWESPRVVMYDKTVQTPRLTARLDRSIDPIVDEMVALSPNGTASRSIACRPGSTGMAPTAWRGTEIVSLAICPPPSWPRCLSPGLAASCSVPRVAVVRLRIRSGTAI